VTLTKPSDKTAEADLNRTVTERSNSSTRRLTLGLEIFWWIG